MKRTGILGPRGTHSEAAAVYLKNTDAAGRTRVRVADFYRFEDGMLAEHWDVLQKAE